MPLVGFEPTSPAFERAKTAHAPAVLFPVRALGFFGIQGSEDPIIGLFMAAKWRTSLLVPEMESSLSEKDVVPRD
jgi:hypothetical protein